MPFIFFNHKIPQSESLHYFWLDHRNLQPTCKNLNRIWIQKAQIHCSSPVRMKMTWTHAMTSLLIRNHIYVFINHIYVFIHICINKCIENMSWRHSCFQISVNKSITRDLSKNVTFKYRCIIIEHFLTNGTLFYCRTWFF